MTSCTKFQRKKKSLLTCKIKTYLLKKQRKSPDRENVTYREVDEMLTKCTGWYERQKEAELTKSWADCRSKENSTFLPKINVKPINLNCETLNQLI